MILTYLLLVSSGFGFESGYGAGLAAEYLVRNLAVYGQADLVLQDKVESNGWRIASLTELRYGSRVFGAAGVSYKHTRTRLWSKTGWGFVLGVGTRAERFQAIARYFLPDSSENETRGALLQADLTTKPFVRVTYAHLWFDDSHDESVTVALGWRW